ncbi:MAG: iron ABC transporter substrate-binding protein [Leptolyngbya sp. LCM1.Bin17]|nr:MAG: iron ABC transporter substrate-binding protein [Leptolyngbya sp. LCM1.Bin17]
MKRRTLLNYVGVAAIAGTLAIACDQPTAVDPDAAEPIDVVEAGSLTIYSGRGESLIGELIAQFESETGISVDIRYGDTAELAAAILEEGENTPADIFFGQDAGALGALQHENLTATIPSELLDQVDSRLRSPEGQWIGISGRSRVLNYNTDLVSEDELPDSVWALTEPEWNGRVGWAPTNGSFQAFVTAMRLTEGEERTKEWLEDLMANDAVALRNNTAIVEALGRGEVEIGLVNNYYLGRFKAEDPNFPVAQHNTQDDAGAMINVAGVAIINTTEQEEAALAFIEFLLTPEAQRYFAEETNEYPLVSGIPGPADQIPLDQIQAPDIDLSDLDDLEGTLVLLEEVGAI